MSDIFSKDKRSWIMSRISGSNTKPEIIVRKIVHRMGFRFRLHANELPGKPDIVLTRHRKIIFINGCFWHGHKNCKRSSKPKTNIEFWEKKITRTIERDKATNKDLRKLGWKILVVWGCETMNTDKLIGKLHRFLS